MHSLRWALIVAFVGGLAIGFGAWAILVVESVRAVLCLKPTARHHRYVRWNRFNALPRRELFTEQGIVHRHRAFVALLWFFGGLATSAVAYGTTALLFGSHGS